MREWDIKARFFILHEERFGMCGTGGISAYKVKGDNSYFDSFDF